MDYNSNFGTVDAETLANVNTNFDKYCSNKIAASGDRLWAKLITNKMRTDWDDQAINYSASLPKFIKITKDGETTSTYSYILKEQSNIFPNIGINGIHDYQTYVFDESTNTGSWKDEVSLETLASTKFEVKREVVSINTVTETASDTDTASGPTTTPGEGGNFTIVTVAIEDGKKITTTETHEWKTPEEVNSSIVEKIKKGYDIYVCSPYKIIVTGTVGTTSTDTTPKFIHADLNTDVTSKSTLEFLCDSLNSSFEEIEDSDSGKITYKVNGTNFTFNGATVEDRRLLVGFSVHKINRGNRTLLFDSNNLPDSFSFEEIIDTDLTSNFGIEYDLLFVESPFDGLVQYKTETYYEGIRIDNPNRV